MTFGQSRIFGPAHRAFEWENAPSARHLSKGHGKRPCICWIFGGPCAGTTGLTRSAKGIGSACARRFLLITSRSWNILGHPNRVTFEKAGFSERYTQLSSEKSSGRSTLVESPWKTALYSVFCAAETFDGTRCHPTRRCREIA